jgi:hypothetical protein
MLVSQKDGMARLVCFFPARCAHGLSGQCSLVLGETFTAYLGALNASKDHPVRRLTITAQLQTPHQRWSLPSALDM